MNIPYTTVDFYIEYITEIAPVLYTLFDDLRIVHRAYIDARKHKATKDAHLEFSIDLYRNLFDLNQDLRTGRYKIMKSICFVVTRPKPREVFAASFRDRIVHHLVMKYLMPFWDMEFIRDAYSCRKGKGTQFGVLRCQEELTKHPNYFIVKGDIHGFFMNIDKVILEAFVQESIDTHFIENQEIYTALSWLCEEIIFNNPTSNCEIHGDPDLFNLIEPEKTLFLRPPHLGLAIGNLTSQWFAGKYMDGFDQEAYRRYGTHYGRYVDDFWFIGTKEECLEFIKWAREYLMHQLGLELHPNKIYIQPVYQGVKFTGSVIKKSRIYSGNRTVGNCYKAIHKINCLAKKKTTNIKEIKKTLSTLNSYLGFFKNTRSFNIRKRIVGFIDPWWFQTYLDIDNKYTKVGFKPKYKFLNVLRG